MKKTMMGLVVALTLGGYMGAPAQETYRLSGSDVAVYNLAGHVELVRGSGQDVVVHITLGGEDAGRLSVETGDVRGREALRVLYPSDEVVYPAMGRNSSTSLQIRSDGTFGESGSRSGERVRIHGSRGDLEAWADMVVEIPAGHEFAVYLAAGEVESRGVDGRVLIDTGSGNVTSQDMSGFLEIDTGSGSVAVLGMNGSLDAETGSGSVRVEDVVGDDVVVDTGSGEVAGEGIRAAQLEVDTGSGSIQLTGVTADAVVLDTGSGSVVIELTSDIESLDIDTGSGDVTVRAPESLGAEVEIETGSGGIDTDFAVEVRTVRRDELVGRIGDGGGTISIDTGSGSIRIIRN